MRVPGAAEMLNMWERGVGKSSIERSMDLLSLSSIGEDPGVLSIGRRDVHLFWLRERLFGARLSSIADCPSCRERVEWAGDVGDLVITGEEKDLVAAHVFMLHVEPYTLRCRLPNSYDLLKANAERSGPERLLRDCILEVRKGAEHCNAIDLPEEILDRLDLRMAEEDPQADVSMLLSCPKCSHRWEMSFDICSYLWMEIDNWARRILREVAVLASAFGWSESDILNMSPRRRRMYLEMIRQ